MSDTCYIVDTESVQNRWGHLLKSITPNDDVVAFFDNNCTPMTLNFINALLRSGAHIELISRIQEIKSAVAINFQLVTELGYRIANAPNTTYVLVSENIEYDPLIEYWTRKNVDIRRFNILSSKPDDIPMSYNFRPNDPFKLIKEQLPNEPGITTIGAAIRMAEEKKAAEEQNVDKNNTAEEVKPEPVKQTAIRRASRKECQQEYYVRLNKMHIPANRSKQIAELLVPIMEKPENQRMLGLYNAMSSAFGKKGAFVKTYYQQVKMLVAEINLSGPLPEENAS